MGFAGRRLLFLLEFLALLRQPPDSGAHLTATRVKICGITSVEDAIVAANAGADAIGLVFYSGSSRNVSAKCAAKIARAVGPYTSVVGLFVNASVDEVESIVAEVPLHVLQFHGDESAEFCRQFGRPWYKALRMSPDLDPTDEMGHWQGASGFLFDSWQPGKYGGTGETFDWQRLPKAETPFVLAGGLNPENVAEAVRLVQPYGVDVSGGVESAPGKKCPQKIKLFIERAKSVTW